jgi:hypothetical protein
MMGPWKLHNTMSVKLHAQPPLQEKHRCDESKDSCDEYALVTFHSRIVRVLTLHKAKYKHDGNHQRASQIQIQVKNLLRISLG